MIPWRHHSTRHNLNELHNAILQSNVLKVDLQHHKFVIAKSTVAVVISQIRHATSQVRIRRINSRRRHLI